MLFERRQRLRCERLVVRLAVVVDHALPERLNFLAARVLLGELPELDICPT
jgi:hypothetical protein